MASSKGSTTHLEAGQNDVLSSYTHISVAPWCTEVKDSVQGQFKLRTCPDERAANWLHLIVHIEHNIHILMLKIATVLNSSNFLEVYTDRIRDGAKAIHVCRGLAGQYRLLTWKDVYVYLFLPFEFDSQQMGFGPIFWLCKKWMYFQLWVSFCDWMSAFHGHRPHLGAKDVSLVVHVASLLLQVELDPVMEANDVIVSSCLSHKHMFKSTWVIHSSLSRPPVKLLHRMHWTYVHTYSFRAVTKAMRCEHV